MIVPLFPLHSVLFPGGRLPLKIFEARYMDMAKACLKDNSPFGVCLIAAGEEVARSGGTAATPHPVGTLAQIAEWDMPQLGVLQVVAEGGDRFRIRSHQTRASGLLEAEIEPIAEPPVTKIPGDYARLVPLLRAIIVEMTSKGQGPAAPHRFFDAGWLGMRYAEILPVGTLAKQKLLEMEDSIDRLEVVYRFLDGKGLLPAV